MTEEVLLEVQDLRTWFPNGKRVVQAVNGVSFTVHRGEVFGLVGESGCGKSATCRSLIKLVQGRGRIVGGSISYRGQNLVPATEKQMMKVRGHEIAMIFQEPMNTLNPVTTIGTQLMEAIRTPNMTGAQKKARAVELLGMVGIPSPEMRLQSFPHQFSGGMRQRAMIAIALAAKPHLLLADEPTTALDVTIQDQIIKLLLRLKDELDMSMILVTHDLGVASEMCDTIAVMYAGTIMELAPADVLFRAPRNPYTYGLMRSLPLSGSKAERLTPIRGAPPDLSSLIQGCPFAERCDWRKNDCICSLPALKEIAPGHFSRCLHAQEMSGVTCMLETEREEESSHANSASAVG
jgi:oligopeptide/dipeptide ABC transporter ATP-binding protein